VVSPDNFCSKRLGRNVGQLRVGASTTARIVLVPIECVLELIVALAPIKFLCEISVLMSVLMAK